MRGSRARDYAFVQNENRTFSKSTNYRADQFSLEREIPTVTNRACLGQIWIFPLLGEIEKRRSVTRKNMWNRQLVGGEWRWTTMWRNQWKSKRRNTPIVRKEKRFRRRQRKRSPGRWTRPRWKIGDTPVSQKWAYRLHNPPITFHIPQKPLVKMPAPCFQVRLKVFISSETERDRCGKPSVKDIELRCRAAPSEYRTQSKRFKEEDRLLPFFPKESFYTGK